MIRMTQKFLNVLLAGCILFCFQGCANEKENENYYKYPDSLTHEYAYANYSALPYNYIHQCAYSNEVPRDSERYPTDYFYAIPNIPNEELLVHINGTKFMRVGYTVTLSVKNGVEFNPINDYQIKGFELYWNKLDDFHFYLGYRDLGFNDDYDFDFLLNLGNRVNFKNLCVSDNPRLIEQLKMCIQNNDNYIDYDYKTASNERGDMIYNSDEEGYLSLRIHFEETSVVTWDAYIVKNDGHYVLTLWEDDARRLFDCIPLTEELEAYIEEQLFLMQ